MTLRNGGSVLEVAPGVGGCITRYATEFDDRTLEWLRPATEAAIAGRPVTEMSCFPLVPFSNRIRDARFSFGGRDIQLTPNFPPEPHAIHGHGWTAQWDVLDQGDDSLTLGYEHPADEWPFPYRAQETFSLSATALEIKLEVHNIGTETMPLGFGFHPFFVRSEKTRFTTQVDGMWASDGNAMPTELVAVPQDVPLSTGFDPNDVSLDNHFTGWDRQLLVEWFDRDARLTMTADGPFGFLVVFTPPGEGFACAEPVTNTLDAFNLAAAGRTDTGIIELAAGGSTSGSITLRPEA